MNKLAVRRDAIVEGPQLRCISAHQTVGRPTHQVFSHCR
jgi:hypothetical protein